MTWINKENAHFSWISSLFHHGLTKVIYLTYTGTKIVHLPTTSLVKVNVVLLCRTLNEWQTCHVFPVTHGLNNGGFLIACKVKRNKSFDPGIVNRVHSNSIHGLRSIEFDNRTKSKSLSVVLLTSELVVFVKLFWKFEAAATPVSTTHVFRVFETT